MSDESQKVTPEPGATGTAETGEVKPGEVLTGEVKIPEVLTGEAETGEVDAVEGEETETSTAVVPAAPKRKADELKIVIIMKDARFMISVGAPDCDPYSEVMEGNLEAVMLQVPKTVEAARAKWATNKRNPKADLPTPPPPPPRSATSSTSSRASTATKTKPAAPKAQPNFF